jgi:hypothetical protein
MQTERRKNSDSSARFHVSGDVLYMFTVADGSVATLCSFTVCRVEL